MAASSSCRRARAANSSVTARNRAASSPSGGAPPRLISPVKAAMRTRAHRIRRARRAGTGAPGRVPPLHAAEPRQRRRADRRLLAFRRREERGQRASVRIVRQVADRVRSRVSSGPDASVRARAIRRSSASGRAARPPLNASARSTSAVRRPLGHQAASASTAHDAGLSAWHSLQALGMAKRAVFSGVGRLIE